MSTAADRIRASFKLLEPQAPAVVERFYQLLFADHPQLRLLFPSDMTQQKAHLLAAVGLVVKHADNLGSLEQPLQEMGARHVRYGARPEHYPVVRDTLVLALKQVAGDAWKAEYGEAWTGALNVVAGAMIRGAEGASRRTA